MVGRLRSFWNCFVFRGQLLDFKMGTQVVVELLIFFHCWMRVHPDIEAYNFDGGNPNPSWYVFVASFGEDFCPLTVCRGMMEYPCLHDSAGC